MSILEAVVSVAIIVGVVLGLVNIFDNLLAISRGTLETAQATSLLTEGTEVVRLWRDANWINLANLTVDTDYFYNFSAGAWATSTINQFVDGKFERRFRLTNVYRDANDDITSAGGTLDPDARLVNVSVAWWKDGATSTKSVSFYLTKLF